MSKIREQAFLNGMVRAFRKAYRMGMTPLQVVKCLRIAWEKEIGYEYPRYVGRH